MLMYFLTGSLLKVRPNAKKAKPKVSKEILYKNITAIQESMAPAAFTMYVSGEQALYMTCQVWLTARLH